MRVYALVGASGTGKSYRALSLASEKGISYILDDGLFIKETKVIAGVSAKKETTKIAAVKRALFMDPVHAENTREAIERERPQSILILGTSANMVSRITDQLRLPAPIEWIRIQDIASDQEMRIAQRQRKEEGKHVIPVPTFEIRKDFSGYFIDPLRIFRVRGKERWVEAVEKTVVRPTYSYRGRYVIADSAVESLAQFNAENVRGIDRVISSSAISRVDGVCVYLDVAVVYGERIDTVLYEVQRKITADIEKLTGLNVLSVNVNVKKIVVQ